MLQEASLVRCIERGFFFHSDRPRKDRPPALPFGFEISCRYWDGQIDATDRQIDQLVYELYGLRSEEIGIVEAAAK
jgi:hypothetical protein